MKILAILVLVNLVVLLSEFNPKRFDAKGGFTVDAPLEKVFPMFEPIGEKEWADGWNPQPIYPPTIEPAAGTVFLTAGKKGFESIWTITRFELNRTVEYNIVTPAHDVTQIVVVCERVGPSTKVRVVYRITGLSEKGNEFGSDYSRNFGAIMAHWKDHISHALAKRVS